MKTNLLALLLAAAMILTLAACERNEDAAGQPEVTESTAEADGDVMDDSLESPGNEEDVIQDSTTLEDQPENLPADPAEEPQVGNRPSDLNQAPEIKPVQKPVDLPEEKPAEDMTPTNVDLAAFYESLASDDNWPAMMQMEGETLDAFYPGLSEIEANQCGVYTAMISATVGEIALVEVKDAGDVQRAKDIFQARIDYQVGDGTNPGGAWYPDSIEGWKNNARIVSNGCFVMMVAWEGAEDVVTAFHALFS